MTLVRDSLTSLHNARVTGKPSGFQLCDFINDVMALYPSSRLDLPVASTNLCIHQTIFLHLSYHVKMSSRFQLVSQVKDVFSSSQVP